MKRHMIDVLFVLLLFCVFTMTSLSVVYVGLEVYKNTTQSLDQEFMMNTSLQYIIEKVRQNNKKDAVDISYIENTPALRLHQKYEDQDYYTYIYQDQNQLKELFILADKTAHLEDGEYIMEIKRFEVSKVQNNLLYITLEFISGYSESHYISIL